MSAEALPKCLETRAIYESYPPRARDCILKLRGLILECAEELGLSAVLQESLKWGEPSFTVPGGSPLRVAWKSNVPEEYGLYFICTSHIIASVRRLYGDLFRYQKTRALLFRIGEPLPKNELRQCIKMAMRYQKLKAEKKMPKFSGL